jgi:hypothetical protein
LLWILLDVILNPEGVKNPRPKGGRPFATLRVTRLKKISLNQFNENRSYSHHRCRSGSWFPPLCLWAGSTQVRLKTAIGGTWLPETIGNIIGVASLVGLVCWFVHHRESG